MELLLVRHNSGKDSTVGVLLDAATNEFFGYTCEDEERTQKVAGETRIPEGRYAVGFNVTGGMNGPYKARYGDAHHGMLELQDVPGFSYIYIHTGNTEKDTDGCILVGYNASTDRSFGGGAVGNSRGCYRDFYKIVSRALLSGEPVHITVTTMRRLLNNEDPRPCFD